MVEQPDPIRATKEEADRLEALAEALEGSEALQVILPGGETMEVPASAREALRRAVRELAGGRAVAVASLATELTTQQAADLLGVSRPYLIQLLEEGRIPYRKVGAHRRVRLEDLLAYKGELEEERYEALRRLVEESERLGLRRA